MNATSLLSVSLLSLLAACGGKGATCEEYLDAYESCAIEAVGEDGEVTIEEACDSDEAEETTAAEWQCGIDAFESADCSSIEGVFDATAEADDCQE